MLGMFIIFLSVILSALAGAIICNSIGLAGLLIVFPLAYFAGVGGGTLAAERL